MHSRTSLCILAAVLAAPAGLAAQQSDHVVIVQPVKHDTSPQFSDLKPGPESSGHHVVPLYKPSRGGGGGGGTGSSTDPLLQSSASGTSVSSFGQSFEGVGYGFPLRAGGVYTDPYIPPDTNGAAGLSQYVQWVNVDFAVFAKNGSILYAAAPGNTIWSGFGGSCESSNGGDPIVQYDKLHNVWVMMQIQYSGFGGGSGNYICIAVSNGDDWSNANFGFYRYAFQFSTLTDYPKLGVWSDGYYVTYNAFKGFGTFAGPVVCALKGSDMRGGLATTPVCTGLSTSYSSLLPADIDSASQQPISGEPEYLLSMGSNQLLSWRYSVNWSSGTATLSGPQALTTTTNSSTTSNSIAFQQACGGGVCVPQFNTTQQLDSLGDRLMYRAAYRNFGSYESLVVNQSVTASSTSAKTGIRWYELRNTASTSATAPSIYQAGTYSPDTEYRWMGSTAMDGSGNIAVGYSVSGTDMHPAIRVAGRCAGDTKAQLRAETSLQEGGGSQSGYSRWGDYSSMSVDPSDGSLWYTTEYLTQDGSNWHTRIANFSLSCP